MKERTGSRQDTRQDTRQETRQDSRALAPQSQAGLQAGLHESAEIILAFDDNRLASKVFGLYDQNLAHLERRLGIVANANGNHVVLKGSADVAERARRVLEELYARARRGEDIAAGDIDGAIQETALQGSLFPQADTPQPRRAGAFEQITTRRRGPVRARNAAQDVYLRALRKYELVFAEGPAGTGKTWLAVGHAVSLLEQGIVDRMILSRPAVEAGERLGFLPGDMKEKVDPYLRPIYDALFDFMEARSVERGLQTGMIEIAPLAFMRGRTLSKAVVLLDEAQNCTPMQMKMFLTRLGEGSRMIITGDPTQIDLPPGQRSGLIEAVHLLQGVEGIGFAPFKEGDVVRHDLVRRIVSAYEAAAREAQPNTAAGSPDNSAVGRILSRRPSVRPAAQGES
ncbi:MAG: PhoH family protein [Beijerinckiaceae bacterium]